MDNQRQEVLRQRHSNFTAKMFSSTWLCIALMCHQYGYSSGDYYLCNKQYCAGDDPSVAPIINEIRVRPMEPKPSLRSQAKKMTFNPLGTRPLTSNNEKCEDSYRPLVREDELQKLQQMAEATMKGYNNSEHFSILLSLTPITAVIYVDGYQYGLHSVDSNTYDGKLTLGVIHPSSGVMVRKYQCIPHGINSHHYLTTWLTDIPQGYLIVIAINAYSVSESVRSFLSTHDAHPPMKPNSESGDGRVVWSWVGRWGGNGPMKEVGGWIPLVMLKKNDLHPPMLAEAYVPKIPAEKWCKNVTKPDEVPKTVWDARVKLCSDFAGYGPFCSCPLNTTANANKINKEIEQQLLTSSDTLTVIIAHQPTLLHKLLETVLSSPGGNQANTLVFTPELNAELQLVCDSHGVPIYETRRFSDCEDLQTLYLYQGALFHALMLRPRAEFFITLEDDMLITDQFYRWMAHAQKVLKTSDKYICANSIAKNPSERIEDIPKDETFLGISPLSSHFSAGWSARREIVELMMADWPLAEVDTSWDAWLLHWAGEVVPNWRPCISPVRSVARHAFATAHFAMAYPIPVYLENTNQVSVT